MAKEDEQILVVERSKIEQVGMFHGLVFDIDPYLDVIFQGLPQFKLRKEMETDPSGLEKKDLSAIVRSALAVILTRSMICR